MQTSAQTLLARLPWSPSEKDKPRAARLWTTGVIALYLASLGSPANALSLRDAFVAAYTHNASLQAERYKTRASDDGVSEALSGYRPRVNADAFYGGAPASRSLLSATTSLDETYGYGVTLEQPLFDGFKTHYGVQQAEANVRASREDLKAAENEVLFRTASSYLDVLRDEGIVLYRRKALHSLERFLLGIEEQFARQQLTRTDVAQARLRVATAKSDLKRAHAQLQIAQLRFANITQRAADGFKMPDMPPSLPTSLSRANAIARESSPILGAASSKREAAEHAARKMRGEMLPQVGLVAGYDASFNETETAADRRGFSVIGRVRMPLYQGGAVSARIRQAKNTAAGLGRETLAAERNTDEAVGAAWAEFNAARARVATDELAVASSEQALEGVSDEQDFGRRTVLDVLDANRELINARIELLQSVRDTHVGAYLLLRATGQLTLARMAPAAKGYDPAHHYAKVRNVWWGTTPPDAQADPFLGAQAGDQAGGQVHAGHDEPSWSTQVHRAGVAP